MSVYFLMLITKGIPQEFKIVVWDFLVDNTMQINRNLFTSLLKKSIQDSVCSTIIIKDLERTFFYFFKHKDFEYIMQEAKNFLLLWEVTLI